MAAEGTGLFRDLGIDGVPHQSGQKGAGAIFFCRTHPGENLDAGDFTRMKDPRGSLPFEQVPGSRVPA